MLKCNNFCLKTSPLFSLSFLFSRKTLQLFFQVFSPQNIMTLKLFQNTYIKKNYVEILQLLSRNVMTFFLKYETYHTKYYEVYLVIFFP